MPGQFMVTESSAPNDIVKDWLETNCSQGNSLKINVFRGSFVHKVITVFAVILIKGHSCCCTIAAQACVWVVYRSIARFGLNAATVTQKIKLFTYIIITTNQRKITTSAPHLYDAKTFQSTWQLPCGLIHQIRFEKLLAITSAAEHHGTKLEIRRVRQGWSPATRHPVLHEKVYLSKIALQAITPRDGVILSAGGAICVCVCGRVSPTRRRFN